MDVAAFEHWLGEIAALNLLQRRQAWQALALSEASDSLTVRLASLWVRALQALV
jgi:hypothetical protein